MVKKIRVCANYDNSENLTNRLLRQFLTPEINLENIMFVYDDSYDVIVFFNHVNMEFRSDSRAYVFPHEPSWNGSHQKVFSENTTIFGFDKSLYSGGVFVESLAHTFYGGRGPWIDKLDFWCYENLINQKNKKVKNISSSITDIDFNYGSTCTYPQRKKIFDNLEEFNFIDNYGDSRISPERKNSLIDYKFNLCIENEHQKNWITEKFYDSILNDTIPIYYGCKNIKEIYPEDGYILLENISDMNYISETLRHIDQNSDEIYSSKISKLKEIKKRYFEEYNLLKKIINL